MSELYPIFKQEQLNYRIVQDLKRHNWLIVKHINEFKEIDITSAAVNSSKQIECTRTGVRTSSTMPPKRKLPLKPSSAKSQKLNQDGYNYFGSNSNECSDLLKRSMPSLTDHLPSTLKTSAIIATESQPNKMISPQNKMELNKDKSHKIDKQKEINVEDNHVNISISDEPTLVKHNLLVSTPPEIMKYRINKVPTAFNKPVSILHNQYTPEVITKHTQLDFRVWKKEVIILAAINKMSIEKWNLQNLLSEHLKGHGICTVKKLKQYYYTHTSQNRKTDTERNNNDDIIFVSEETQPTFQQVTPSVISQDNLQVLETQSAAYKKILQMLAKNNNNNNIVINAAQEYNPDMQCELNAGSQQESIVTRAIGSDSVPIMTENISTPNQDLINNVLPQISQLPMTTHEERSHIQQDASSQQPTAPYYSYGRPQFGTHGQYQQRDMHTPRCSYQTITNTHCAAENMLNTFTFPDIHNSQNASNVTVRSVTNQNENHLSFKHGLPTTIAGFHKSMNTPVTYSNSQYKQAPATVTTYSHKCGAGAIASISSQYWPLTTMANFCCQHVPATVMANTIRQHTPTTTLTRTAGQNWPTAIMNATGNKH